MPALRAMSLMHFCDLLGMLLSKLTFQSETLTYSEGQYVFVIIVFSNLDAVPPALLTQSLHTARTPLKKAYLKDAALSSFLGKRKDSAEVRVPSTIPHQLRFTNKFPISCISQHFVMNVVPISSVICSACSPLTPNQDPVKHTSCT